MAVPNGYMVYLLRILAAQGALASIYTDPNDPDGFCAGICRAVRRFTVCMPPCVRFRR